MDELNDHLRRAANGPEPRFTSADIARRVHRRRTARRTIGGGAMAVLVVVAGVVLAMGAGGGDTPTADEDPVGPQGTSYCDVLGLDSWTRLNDGQPVDAIMFVEPDATADQVEELARLIIQDPAVVSSTFVDQHQALEAYNAMFADTPEMLDAVDRDQLPSSFRVDLADDQADAGVWSEQLSDLPGVFRVVTVDDTFPNGATLIDTVVRPLAIGAGESVLVSGATGQDLDALVTEAPDGLKSDAELLRSAIEEGATPTASLVELTPEVLVAANRLLDWYDAECGDDEPPPLSETDPDAPSTWEPLPAAPVDARSGAATIWTGTEVIVVGGFDIVLGTDSDGSAVGTTGESDSDERTPIHEERDRRAAAYDPSTREWRELPDLPIALEYVEAAVWTGTEAVILGSVQSQSGVYETALLAYDPVIDSWRSVVVPDGVDFYWELEVAWTGEEVLMWGHAYHNNEAPPLAARYDPASDTWSAMAPGPGFRELPASAWTGSELIIIGGNGPPPENLPEGVAPDLADVFAAAYDPASNTWRALPDPPSDGFAGTEAVWTGEEVIVWSGIGTTGQASGAAYDPESNTWRTIADAPIPGRIYQVMVATDAGVVIVDGVTSLDLNAPPTEGTALYRPDDDSWTLLGDPPGGLACRSSAVWTGSSVILWGGSIGCADVTEPREFGWELPLASGEP